MSNTFVDIEDVNNAIRELCKKYNITYGGDLENTFAFEIARVTDKCRMIGVDLAQKETAVSDEEVEVEEDVPSVEYLLERNKELCDALKEIAGIIEDKVIFDEN